MDLVMAVMCGVCAEGVEGMEVCGGEVRRGDYAAGGAVLEMRVVSLWFETLESWRGWVGW